MDVLLIGDSHADSLSDGVLAATERLGLSLGVRTVNGQPPLGDEGWVQRHRELIATTEPAVVILTARSTRYVESLLDRWLPEGDAERTGASIEEVWIEELLAAVQGFRALGPQVIVVQNVPEFPERERARATLLTVYRHQEISLADLQAQRGELLALERLVLADLDGVIVLDPAESLCTPECRSGAEDRFFYYDSNHLSPEGSRLVADQLARALREATGR